MATLSTWLKQTGGALFACLMLCLSIVPTLDAVICSSDAPAAAKQAFVQSGGKVVVATHDHTGAAHQDGGGDACVHGHCHQSASPTALVDVALAANIASPARLTPAETGLPPSRAPDGLMEPPRA